MQASEIIIKAMARCGLSKNTVADPFNTTDQMINEFIDAANSLLADLSTNSDFSTLLKTCEFTTYRNWTAGNYAAGDSRISVYNGKPTRFKTMNAGQSEFAPQGTGKFTMNKNPQWAQGMNVAANSRVLSDDAEWRAMTSGTAGAIAPTAAGANRVAGYRFNDGAVTWVFVREVLYWKNMGDPNFYPFNEICPDFSYLSQNTVIDMTQNRTMTYINDQTWQRKVATNVVDGYAHFYTMNRGGLRLYPTYPQNDRISFNYYTNNVVLDENNEEKAQFSAATDTCLFPDWMIIFGTAMRWKQSKKLDALAEENDFSAQKERFIAQTQTGDAIRMDGIPSTDLSSMPVGGWEIGG